MNPYNPNLTVFLFNNIICSTLWQIFTLKYTNLVYMFYIELTIYFYIFANFLGMKQIELLFYFSVEIQVICCWIFPSVVEFEESADEFDRLLLIIGALLLNFSFYYWIKACLLFIFSFYWWIRWGLLNKLRYLTVEFGSGTVKSPWELLISPCTITHLDLSVKT